MYKKEWLFWVINLLLSVTSSLPPPSLLLKLPTEWHRYVAMNIADCNNNKRKNKSLYFTSSFHTFYCLYGVKESKAKVSAVPVQGRSQDFSRGTYKFPNPNQAPTPWTLKSFSVPWLKVTLRCRPKRFLLYMNWKWRKLSKPQTLITD